MVKNVKYLSKSDPQYENIIRSREEAIRDFEYQYKDTKIPEAKVWIKKMLDETKQELKDLKNGTYKEADISFLDDDNKSSSSDDERPELTRKEKHKLLRNLPDHVYTEKQLIKLIGYIKNGKLRHIDDLPTPVLLGVKVALSDVVANVEPQEKEVIPEHKPTKATKGKTTKKEKPEKPQKPLKPYFKIGELPKGYRRATMEEAMKENKVFYYGVKKIDNKLIDFYTKEPETRKSLASELSATRVKYFKIVKKLKETPSHEDEIRKDLMNEQMELAEKVKKLTANLAEMKK